MCGERQKANLSRIMSEYKSKYFCAEIYSIQFRLMKRLLARGGIDVNGACVMTAAPGVYGGLKEGEENFLSLNSSVRKNRERQRMFSTRSSFTSGCELCRFQLISIYVMHIIVAAVLHSFSSE